MLSRLSIRLVVWLGCVGLSLLAVTASAADYPSKPIRWIVPFPPGGAIDMVSRVLAQRVSQTLGQPVTVENRPGSGGIIGSAEVARSPADGYTLLVNSTVLAVDKWFYPNVAYDARKAFAPVALLATIPSVLVVPADSPYKDARSLLAYAKANPGKVSFASAGMGTSIHLAAALLAAQAGVDLLHVPYKGSTPAAADLIAGRVSMMVDSIAAQQSFIKSGRVRALGVTSLQPAPSLPGIPPLAQAADLPKFEVLSWFGLFVPSRTSPDIVKVLNTAMNEALKTPEVQKALADIGASAQGGTSQALGVLWDNEIDRWGQLIVHHRLNTQ